MATIPIIRLSLPPFKSLHLPKPIITPRISCSYPRTSTTDRLISSATYFFPLFNGFRYGSFLFMQHPITFVPFKPLIPILSFSYSMPFRSFFISFLALYFGIVRNTSLSGYVRLNGIQALFLGVPFAVPLLLHDFLLPGLATLGIQSIMRVYSAAFVFLAGCFVYGLIFSVLGRTPWKILISRYFPATRDDSSHP